MLGRNLEEVRSAALSLSDLERAKLAHDLVQSLDAPAETDVADAWEREIDRRVAQVDAGTAALIDRNEFRRRLAARLDRA